MDFLAHKISIYDSTAPYFSHANLLWILCELCFIHRSTIDNRPFSLHNFAKVWLMRLHWTVSFAQRQLIFLANMSVYCILYLLVLLNILKHRCNNKSTRRKKYLRKDLWKPLPWTPCHYSELSTTSNEIHASSMNLYVDLFWSHTNWVNYK